MRAPPDGIGWMLFFEIITEKMQKHNVWVKKAAGLWLASFLCVQWPAIVARNRAMVFFSVGGGRYAIAAVGTAGRQHHAQKRGRPPPTAGLEKSAAKKKKEYADAFAQLVRVMLFAGQKRIFYFYILKNKKRAKTDCDGAIARTRTRLGRAKTDVRNEFIFLP